MVIGRLMMACPGRFWVGRTEARRHDRKLKSVSPAEMLAEEFLKPLGMSNYRLAKGMGVPAQRIGEILAC
jgi:hypothetical protein